MGLQEIWFKIYKTRLADGERVVRWDRKIGTALTTPFSVLGVPNPLKAAPCPDQKKFNEIAFDIIFVSSFGKFTKWFDGEQLACLSIVQKSRDPASSMLE